MEPAYAAVKCNALAFGCRHIKSVIPISAAKPHIPMFPAIKELCQLLNQKMLKQRTLINVSVRIKFYRSGINRKSSSTS